MPFCIFAGTARDDYDYWRYIEYPRGAEYIELDNEIVPTPDDITGDSFLVSQPWIYTRIYETMINGDLIVIRKDSGLDQKTLD